MDVESRCRAQGEEREATLTAEVEAPLLLQRRDDVAGLLAPRAVANHLVTPWRLLAVVAAAALLSFKGIQSFVDPDVYWHVELGREMVERGQVTGTGTSWSFTLPEAMWTSTQWLSEVAFAGAHAAAGWSGIALLRLALAGLVTVALGLLLLRQHRTPWAALVYAVVLMIVSTAWQERPQLFSLVLLVWLSWHCHAVLMGRAGTPLWGIFLVTVLWANLHGLWVLVPACLGVVAVGRLLDALAGRRVDAAVPGLLLKPVVALVAACLTPVGPALLLTPLRFASATEYIDEWQPTSFHEPYTVIYGVALAVLVFAWARADQVRAGELVYALALITFSLLAERNVVPVTILLAPVLLDRLDTLWPRHDRIRTALEGRVLTGAAATAVTVFALQGFAAWQVTPHVPASMPLRLVERLDEMPGHHRLLNDHGISGVVIHGTSDDVRVAIDGRADRYGSAYIGAYQDLLSLRGDWEETLRNLDADTAILRRDLPLVSELARHRGWVEVGADGDYVLLRRS